SWVETNRLAIRRQGAIRVALLHACESQLDKDLRLAGAHRQTILEVLDRLGIVTEPRVGNPEVAQCHRVPRLELLLLAIRGQRTCVVAAGKRRVTPDLEYPGPAVAYCAVSGPERSQLLREKAADPWVGT